MLIGLRDRNILPVLILFADKGNATSPPPAARVRRDAVARLRRLRPCPVRRRCGRSDRSLRQKIEKDEAMTAENANGEQQALLVSLAMRTGSETVFRHWTKRLVYTEGVQDLAEQAKAY
jgi:hypothetical protein